MNKVLFTFLITVLASSLFAQKEYTVRGFIYNSDNGEAASYAKVLLKPVIGQSSDNIKGSTTDLDGFFQFNAVKAGDFIVEVRSIEYMNIIDTIEVGQKEVLTLRYELVKSDEVKEIEEVSILGEDQSKRNKIDMSVNKLDQESLERLPSFGAENDILAAFSVTPGVVSTGDQGGQLYVRGGTPIQNKILLDGMTIYNPFHSIGFFSVFETELIKSADIYTGGFASNYGGRISSIMDITYRDGDLKKHGGLVSVSPFMGKAVLEGPVFKNKNAPGSGGSYIFSAKHSLLNYTSKDLYPYANDGDGLPFTFTDIYGKFTIKSPEGSKFSAFGFSNNDAVNYTNVADLNWQSYGGGINFTLVPTSNPVIIKGHLNASNYEIFFQEKAGQAPRTSKINGFDLGFDFIYFLKNQSEITYGINIGGFSTNFKTFNEVNREIKIENFNTELSGYFNYRLVTGRWVVNPGIRLQAYPSVSTVVPEPRLGLKFNATENFRLKMSGGYYSQNFTSSSSDRDVVTLFYGFLSAPTNVQSNFTQANGKETQPENGIQTAWHGIFGFEYDISRPFTVNVEGYYKYFPKLSNINNNKLYDDIQENANIADVYKKDFLIESGVSYGIDVLLEYKKNRLFLWGVYSYGKSDRWDGFNTYAPVFDRRHNVNLVATYSFLKDKSLEISARWNFGSGLPFTPTSGYYQGENFGDGVTTDYTTSNPADLSVLLGDLNSARLPTYHRFDITIKKKFEFKNKNVLELKGGVTNIYNRDNIFYVNRVTNDKIYQLPFLPSIGLSFDF
ncbi:TonB-dependent receptor [Brumimicrobium salinarum]|uniref:TonB-dependent receptor n=1 Tax=Brumimicrobium salinarum TaxID=2058658 RepID=A0A2I0R2H3_9FLAO|nr:TonB-dependent receptor [Brumimicrobium salinarum]PKR80759.1 TonB-dependent receptor [Brumimicrobium salinarum]